MINYLGKLEYDEEKVNKNYMKDIKRFITAGMHLVLIPY